MIADLNAFKGVTMTITCPDCQAPLEPLNGVAHCETVIKISLEARCPECHQPLQVLKACGAVDYFCQNGHGLISKKRVEFVRAEG
jgi:uncharacterized protein YbaR (Trm112 family)